MTTPGSSDSKLKPLLMPSGPQWSENWTDQDPPPLVRYIGYRYKAQWQDRVTDRVRDWPDGAWTLTLDRGTRLGRLWWKQLRPLIARLLWNLTPHSLAARNLQRWIDQGDGYPFGGVPMNWRFVIGPDQKPWKSGDVQPQDGHWPVSIAVYAAKVPD